MKLAANQTVMPVVSQATKMVVTTTALVFEKIFSLACLFNEVANWNMIYYWEITSMETNNAHIKQFSGSTKTSGFWIDPQTKHGNERVGFERVSNPIKRHWRWKQKALSNTLTTNLNNNTRAMAISLATIERPVKYPCHDILSYWERDQSIYLMEGSFQKK